MRFVIYVLFVANVLFAIWYVMRPERADDAGSEESTTFREQLILLTKYRGDLVPEAESAERLGGGELLDDSLTEVSCARLGGFVSLSDARQFGGRFEGDVWYRVGSEDVLLPPLHRVFLPSPGERRDARLLQAEVREAVERLGASIDTYIVVGGEFDNVVSLGMFGESGNALNVQRILSANGFDPQIAIESRLRQVHWLDVEWDEDSDFAKKTQELALTSGLTLSVSENLCEMIAQPD